MAEKDDNQDFRAEWLGILAQLWESVGKEIEPRRFGIYVEQLGDIPMGLLKRAVKRAIRDNGAYQTVPTISAVWAALRNELGNPCDVGQAIADWDESLWRKAAVYARAAGAEG